MKKNDSGLFKLLDPRLVAYTVLSVLVLIASGISFAIVMYPENPSLQRLAGNGSDSERLMFAWFAGVIGTAMTVSTVVSWVKLWIMWIKKEKGEK